MVAFGNNTAATSKARSKTLRFSVFLNISLLLLKYRFKMRSVKSDLFNLLSVTVLLSPPLISQLISQRYCLLRVQSLIALGCSGWYVVEQHRATTIDDNIGPGHKARFVGGDEHRRPGDLVGFANTFDRMHVQRSPF